MKSVFDPAVRQELLSRLEKLTPDAPSQWGKMTPDQMVAHVNGALQVNIGELQAKGVPNPLKAAFLRVFTFSPIPIPKAKAETFAEIKKTGTYDLAQEKKTFAEILERFGKMSNREDWPSSPIFGRLNGDQYGKVAYKHADHHFQQFGI